MNEQQGWKKDPGFPNANLPWTQEENNNEGIAHFVDKAVQPWKGYNGTILEYWWFCFQTFNSTLCRKSNKTNLGTQSYFM